MINTYYYKNEFSNNIICWLIDEVWQHCLYVIIKACSRIKMYVSMTKRQELQKALKNLLLSQMFQPRWVFFRCVTKT